MNMTDSQKLAIESDHQNILVIAGPGSGKTAVIVARIQRLIASGHAAKGMVAITFTNSASGELMRRLPGVALGYVGTLHGFVLHLLKRSGLYDGWAVIDRDESEAELRKVLDKKARITEVRELIKLGPKHAAAALCGKNRPSALCACAYFQHLEQNGLLDFDGILRAGESFIANSIVNGIDFLFVDEFQDTGTLDARIYELLRPFVGNWFVVADSDQSIFGFRGSQVRNVLDLAKRKSTLLIRLEECFRFGPAIAKAAKKRPRARIQA